MDSEDPNYLELSAQDVLANCEDFREENGAMEDLMQSYGNIVLFTSKGHPEIAGAGIKYDWGVSKKVFWKTTNHIAKDCKRDVWLLLSKVTLQVVKNTARKSRSYMRAYKNDAGGSHLLIKKFVKIHKCHRNILDQESAYLEKMVKVIEGHTDDIKQEQVSLAAEKAEPKTKVIDERAPNDGKLSKITITPSNN